MISREFDTYNCKFNQKEIKKTWTYDTGKNYNKERFDTSGIGYE